MAEKLVNDSNLSTFASELKKRFPLITSLATVNGLSLVNGGDNITINGRRDVLFFNGTKAPGLSVKQQGITNPTAIVWDESTHCFVAFQSSSASYYDTWASTDALCGSAVEWGTPAVGGTTPFTDRLYVDYSTRKIYRWNGSALVEIIDTTLFTIVTTLPTASLSTMGKVYLVAAADTGTNNAYTEYITVATESGISKSYKWEKLGEYTPGVDLSTYPTRTEMRDELTKLNAAIGLCLTTTDAQATYMRVADYGYTTMTAAEVVASVTAVFGS